MQTDVETANMSNWAKGEVNPIDLGKEYEPVAKPLLVLTGSQSVIYPLHHQLYTGESLAIMRSWPDHFFDACVTDPPYNIAKDRKGLSWAFSSHVTIQDEWDRFSNTEYETFTANWLAEVCRVTKPNGNIFIFGSYHNIYTIGSIAARMDLRVVNSIIWAKPNAQPNITCRMFTESTEQILWLCNNTSKQAKKWTYNYQHMKELNGGKQMRNYWEIPLTPQRERIHGKHPSQKPLRLMERLILAGTHQGDCVLDCFTGSGSTLLACDRLERAWVGIERDPVYSDIAHRRLDEERRQRRLFPASP
ncbi:MAG: site-specific DNA-methyltransferase [Myxococcaceae bacterium]|nr:site-specific DNA-methyltransferase [Myxococcaceae bacterium]MBH2006532.1 site-specific DNA-methyltransferase [Myxococcaceae bacterium]